MKLCTVLIVAVMLVRAETAKILVSQPFGFKSHQNMFVPLIRELSNRGHSITFITNYGTKDLNANVKQIVLDQLTVEKAIPTNHFQTVQSGSLESAWSLTNVLLFLPRAAADVSAGSRGRFLRLLLDRHDPARHRGTAGLRQHEDSQMEHLSRRHVGMDSIGKTSGLQRGDEKHAVGGARLSVEPYAKTNG